jgi:hypothetical protein
MSQPKANKRSPKTVELHRRKTVQLYRFWGAKVFEEKGIADGKSDVPNKRPLWLFRLFVTPD